jgi:predicted nucleic acid-binding protein
VAWRLDDLVPLLNGAWARRDTLRLTDALYVQLAAKEDLPLLTTDERLALAWLSSDVIE